MAEIPDDAVIADLRDLIGKGVDERTYEIFASLTMQSWLVAIIEQADGDVTIPEPSTEQIIANAKSCGMLRNDDGTITLIVRDNPPDLIASMDLRKMARDVDQRVGRNAPCPCGSGKKYKRCCGA